MYRVAALAVAATLAWTGAAAQDEVHIAYDAPTSYGATSAESVLAGMDQTAARLEAMNATGSRTTQHDVAWPHTPAEPKALGGWTIVLVSAVTADPAELPLAKVYLHLDGSDVVLRPLATRQVRLDPTSRLAMRVGTFREDAFFLAPVAGLLKNGEMRVDFAAHRTGFVLGILPLASVPDFVIAGAASPMGEPQPDAVATMLRREYVGFDGLSPLPPTP